MKFLKEANRPLIKICCIASQEEAQMAINAGASAIGLVGPMPSGPGVIDDKLIREIAENVPNGIDTFLLTSETIPSKIIAHHQRTKTTTIQLVDKVSNETYRQLRTTLPDVKLVQVIHVLDELSVDEALEKSAYVDALLLDSGNPGLKTKVLGGTGKVHNWSLSRQIVEQARVPVFLAGGLNPGNVRQAIEQVQPFGVDVCSGVRSDGKLDTIKLKAFINAFGNEA